MFVLHFKIFKKVGIVDFQAPVGLSIKLFTIKFVGILVIFSVDRSGSRLDPCEI